MIEPKKTGKQLDSNNINEKPTDYKDMYAYQEGYHMLASRHLDDYPEYLKDNETGGHKMSSPAKGDMPHN